MGGDVEMVSAEKKHQSTSNLIKNGAGAGVGGTAIKQEPGDLAATAAQQQLVAEVPTFVRIERLQECGLNVADCAKLKQAGFGTAQSIVGVMRKDLLNIKGLAEAKCDKIMESAQKLACPGSVFKTATEMLDMLEHRVFKISTGASSLDALLKGGIESGSITEVYGEFRSGKTQLCHTAAVTTQLHETQPGRVLYIDTEGTFRADRIQEICRGHGVEDQVDDCMNNILVARALTSEHLGRLLNEASVMMCTEEDPFSLIIIDSIMGCFRTDYCGRGELAERQQNLGKLLSKLKKTAEEFNVAVLVTNQVMADPSGAMCATFANVPKPIGGHVLAHMVTTRLYFRKGKADERVVKVVDSPSLPEGECTIQIYSGGIRNPDGL